MVPQREAAVPAWGLLIKYLNEHPRSTVEQVSSDLLRVTCELQQEGVNVNLDFDVVSDHVISVGLADAFELCHSAHLIELDEERRCDLTSLGLNQVTNKTSHLRREIHGQVMEKVYQAVISVH